MRIVSSVVVATCIAVIPSLAVARADVPAKATAVDKGWVDAAPPAATTPIVVRQFGTDGAKLGTGDKKNKPKYAEVARQMKSSAPVALAQSLVSQLDERGVLGGASLAEGDAVPEGALVLDGEFTVLNPGSRGKRFWVGMGAGKSKLCVEGSLSDATGATLVRFEHCRSGTGNWSFVGGRSEGLMYNDIGGTAEKVAAFLAAWASGRHAP